MDLDARFRQTHRTGCLEAVGFRSAQEGDANGIASVLQNLFDAGKRSKSCTAEFVLGHYISHPDSIRCTVAVERDGRILGFQSLRHAVANNPYDVTVGWGIIGTHIRPAAARRGIGRGLFAQTRDAARAFGLSFIDATIGAENTEGLAYYEAMGFRAYRQPEDAVSKVYQLQ
ncbi:GNAT family N-acetyltransferase [Rhodobacteraceae bacterium B1Z28]|uniref:GNAT family N-acetyltransferase n=1 Tax=Ruegeria haliotis TaxID=2747601 RepID=A0ABX2PYW4_9RHOB|nr:GNAT family N-acetyltransferase [Ruegeria haliotis]NVO58174.1 GNAT family N-acetyltransferase [Ruegeria haliotis]